MNANDITPDIASLLPGDEVVRARSRALLGELGRAPDAGKASRRRRAQLLVAGAAVTAIAAVATLEVSDGGSISQAQAYPVFATDHVTAEQITDGILGSFLKSEGSVPGAKPNAPDAPYWKDAANHAHAFATYWGTAYTLERHDSANGYTVCTILPDNQTAIIPDHGGWVGGCQTAPTLAAAVGGWTTVPDRHGVEFVQLVPAGTTARMAIGHGRPKTVAIPNGVLMTRVTKPTTLTVSVGSSTAVHHLVPGMAAGVSGGATAEPGACPAAGGAPPQHAEAPRPCQRAGRT
jgi:hypothetical protein